MNKTPCGMIRRCRFALHGGIVFFLLSATATAAGYPARPIRLLVPQAPGSASDTVADNPLRPLQAASCTYRIALGARAGELKTIATIEEPAVIVKILTHLVLPARAPPLALFQAA